MAPATIDSPDKKELIDLVLSMAEQIATLQARVAELEAKLGAAQDPGQFLVAAVPGPKGNRAQDKTRQPRKGRSSNFWLKILEIDFRIRRYPEPDSEYDCRLK